MRFHFEKQSISIRNRARTKAKTLGNTNIAPEEKNSTNSLVEISSKTGPDWVDLTLPIVTVSEANGGTKKSYKVNGKVHYKAEHWRDKHSRHKKQKAMVGVFLKPHRSKMKLPCVITLTRYAPNKLDRHDNLPMSLKWILDACCEVITGDYRPGRADDTDEIDVIYKQVISSEYGVRIEITSQAHRCSSC